MNYPKTVMQSVWRRLRKPSPEVVGRLCETPPNPADCTCTPLNRHNPRTAPEIRSRKSTAVLIEILRANELGIIHLPPGLLHQAKDALMHR
jgi:hypothetical protein